MDPPDTWQVSLASCTTVKMLPYFRTNILHYLYVAMSDGAIANMFSGAQRKSDLNLNSRCLLMPTNRWEVDATAPHSCPRHACTHARTDCTDCTNGSPGMHGKEHRRERLKNSRAGESLDAAPSHARRPHHRAAGPSGARSHPRRRRT